MSERRREYFRGRLEVWRDEVMGAMEGTRRRLGSGRFMGDEAERAWREADRGRELRERDRQMKLLRKIESAFGRLREGTYGYCEETGEEIGLERLCARPVATLSVSAQRRREREEEAGGG